jgi:hypothetical protein
LWWLQAVFSAWSQGFVTLFFRVTKPGFPMARPTKKKTGPMTGAERTAKYRKRLRKSINRKRRSKYEKAKWDAKSQQRREVARAAPPLPDAIERRVGDCREVLRDFEPDSVPLILTDPPYGNDAEPLYRWLADFAARVLIPGGSLVCFTGTALLERDMRIFGEHLKFWWQFIMPHDQSARFLGRFVYPNYKPALWYTKGQRRGQTMIGDVLHSTRDKTMHELAQGDGGIWPIIEHLTEPGELIVDPFAGTGTWGLIAHSMGRCWIGSDINPERGR